MTGSRSTDVWISRVLALGTLFLLLSACVPRQPLVAQQRTAEPPPVQPGVAPPAGTYAPGFDAVHYDLTLAIPDTGTEIEGTMRGRFRLLDPEQELLPLDLSGLGVSRVLADGQEAPFQLEAGKLYIAVPEGRGTGDTLDVEVAYFGTPDDGLILGRNLHGVPTAFADNWPDRSRYWFPSIDHPSDKATVEFRVHIRPDRDRSVIANGALVSVEEDSIWHWRTDRPIPTYTMVVGVANFDIATVGSVCEGSSCTEVTTWLFPQDAATGTSSFRRAHEMVAYYEELIAPFPYEKLAHVQAATRFGGMENVSAIFYPEDAISEGRNIEETVAHETAHMWFGNSVTESDWHHLWLSEGFATYFGALFFEHADGVEALRRIMEEDRLIYLQSGAGAQPVVNPAQESLFGLLNTNNYNKAAWVLHMLRSEIGDDAFFEGVRTYYDRHIHGTALTADFRAAMEEVSGRSLQWFFDQWIYRPGHPQLDLVWSWQDSHAELTVRQTQSDEWPTFRFPLEIAFRRDGGFVRRVIEVDERVERVGFDLSDRPSDVFVDPDGTLLKEVASVAER